VVESGVFVLVEIVACGAGYVLFADPRIARAFAHCGRKLHVFKHSSGLPVDWQLILAGLPEVRTELCKHFNRSK